MAGGTDQTTSCYVCFYIDKHPYPSHQHLRVKFLGKGVLNAWSSKKLSPFPRSSQTLTHMAFGYVKILLAHTHLTVRTSPNPLSAWLSCLLCFIEEYPGALPQAHLDLSLVGLSPGNSVCPMMSSEGPMIQRWLKTES